MQQNYSPGNPAALSCGLRADLETLELTHNCSWSQAEAESAALGLLFELMWRCHSEVASDRRHLIEAGVVGALVQYFWRTTKKSDRGAIAIAIASLAAEAPEVSLEDLIEGENSPIYWALAYMDKLVNKICALHVEGNVVECSWVLVRSMACESLTRSFPMSSLALYSLSQPPICRRTWMVLSYIS